MHAWVLLYNHNNHLYHYNMYVYARLHLLNLSPMQGLLLLFVYLIIIIGRLRVPVEYVDDAPEITDDTKLAYLIPTTTGEGICSSSMVDFLVHQHNEFIQFCYRNLPSTHYDPR